MSLRNVKTLESFREDLQSSVCMICDLKLKEDYENWMSELINQEVGLIFHHVCV